jgi:hypothetical protein
MHKWSLNPHFHLHLVSVYYASSLNVKLALSGFSGLNTVSDSEIQHKISSIKSMQRFGYISHY